MPGMTYPNAAQVRQFEADIASIAEFPTLIVEQRLLEAIADVETICERRFVPTLVTESHYADSEGRIYLREGSAEHRSGATQGVVSVVADGTAVTGGTIGRAGRLVGVDIPEDVLVKVTYGTGMAGCPVKIAEIIRRLTRIYVQRPRSGVPERAERFSFDGDGRTYVLSMPAVRALGMPDVDAVISRYSLHHGVTS